MVQGKLALDYGPTPILDTGNQILYGNLAIGADTDPTSGGSNFPTLYFGEPPTDFYYSGYGGWSMESGMIKYEQFSDYGSGRFMFNKPIRIYPIYTESWGAGFHLGSGAGINFANNRTDAYIEGKVEADGGFYGDGSNITNIQGTSVQLNSAGAIVNSSGLKINLATTNPGLAITSNKLDIKLVANEGLTKNSSGVKVNYDNSTIGINGSNQLALTSAYSTGSQYDSRFVNDTGDTMTGELTLTHTGTTNDTQIFDINSTGIMASATNKTIASISDSAAHTTSGNIKGLEITMAGAYNNASADPTALTIDLSGVSGTTGTERGINITMGAASDRAINTNAEIKGGTLTDGTASLTSGGVTGVTTVDVNDGGTLTFRDDGGNTILQLVEGSRTAQIYNLNVNGTTTTINTTTTDADHLTLSPGAVGTTAINIVPNPGITLSGDLITAKKVSTGGNVFVVDKDGNITTVGEVDGIDVSSLATAAVADTVTTIATGDQIYDFVIGRGYITDGNTDWNNSYGYITASDTLTGLVRSTAAGASYITGGKVGIGMTSPTADLTVKGNLATALTNTATSSGTTVTCTAHGLAAGDAVKMPTGAASANEIFTVDSVTDANTFVVDSTPTNNLTSAATIYKDSNLFLVQDGDGVSMMTLDKSGNLAVEGTITATVTGTSSNANLLDNLDSTAFAILAGQSGGQTLNGGTGASENLTLQSTANATKGYILFPAGNVGIGSTTPSQVLDVLGNIAVSGTVDGVDISGHDAATGTSVHGLGTISTQAANNVAITGGTISGISALTVSSGAVSVDAGQNYNLEGTGGDSYMQYNSTNGRLEVFVDGGMVAYFDN